MTTSRANRLQTIDAHTLKQLLDRQAVTLIDVRESGEYAGRAYPGSNSGFSVQL